MAWDWKNIKESASKALSDISSQIDKTIESTSTYVQSQVIPEISKFGSGVMETTRNLGSDIKAGVSNIQSTASSRISDWCLNGKADHIPPEYTSIVES